MDLYASVLEAGRELSRGLATGRRGWLQLTSGSVAVNEEVMAQGDGIATDGPIDLSVTALEDSEILLFDMG